MESDTKKKILRGVATFCFVFFAFLFFVYQSFPYELLIQRLTVNVQRRARLQLQIDKVRPYWLSGVEASGIKIRKAVKKGTAEIQVQDLRFRLGLLGLLVGSIEASFRTALARGVIEGTASRKNKRIKVAVDVDNVNLALLGPPPRVLRRDKNAKPLLAMLFAPVYGRLSGKVKLDIPEPGAKVAKKKKPKAKPKARRRTRRRRRAARRRRRRARRRYSRVRTRRRRRRRSRRARVRGIDPRKVTGMLRLKIAGLSIGPGFFPTSNMGELPVPLLRLGNFLVHVKLDKGRAKIVKCVSVGRDGELHVTGYIQLRPRLAYSIFRGVIRVKINDSFKNSPSTPALLRQVLGALPTPKSGYHRYRVELPFRGRPRFRRF